MNDQPPRAILLYDQPISVDKGAVIKALKHFHPEACADAKFSERLFAPEDHLTLLVSGKTVDIKAVLLPLQEHVWRPAAEGWSAWKEAVATCARNRFHIIVGTREPMTKLSCARLTSAIAGAIAVAHKDMPTAGLWIDGTSILNSGKRFAELACMSFKPSPQIPTGLWTTMLSFTDTETGTAIVLTVGLGRFGHLELEFEAPLAHQDILTEQCRNVVNYLVDHEGQQLGHGSEFAIPELCHWVVTKRASQRFNGIGVYFATLTIIKE